MLKVVRCKSSYVVFFVVSTSLEEKRAREPGLIELEREIGYN